MNRIICIILLSIQALALLADSSGKCGEGLSWRLSDGILTITGQGAMKDTGSGAIPWNPGLVKQVILEEGITHIGDNAFGGSGIFSVEVPPTVQSIGRKAFAGCRNLTSVKLPYGLTSIGAGAFKDCHRLVKIDLPASLKSIEAKAFQNCSMLQSVFLSDRLLSVGDNVFRGCRSLDRILSLPETITTDNCHYYGLAYSAVSEYYDGLAQRATTKSEPSAALAHSQQIPEPVRKKDAGTVVSMVKYGESDVDRDIPVRPQTNSSTFAFIFANENYSSMPDVPFAVNDGKSFYNYCLRTLGIPEENITVNYNATLGTMLQGMEYMKQLDAAFRGDLSIIVYYAGHGAPDEKTSRAYMIPTDAFAINERTCYPLEDFYKTLGSLKANNVKVFMDACFSGTGRTEDMLALGGRSVKAVPKKETLSGNVVVVSATASDQTAWHYQRQGHGLFTYCLLKKLQQTGGDVSMGELCDYLESEVPKISIISNKKTQTPTSLVSPGLGNRWKMWQIKN